MVRYSAKCANAILNSGYLFAREVARVIESQRTKFSGMPIEIVSTGLPFAIVGIRNPETLTNLKVR